MIEKKLCKCPYCEKEFDNYTSLSRHATRMHKLKAPQVYVDYYHNGEYPTCKCGCGEQVGFQFGSRRGFGFNDFIKGHASRINNNWGHNETAIVNSANTRRKQFANGEREPWNKGLSLEDDPTNEGLLKLREMNLKESCPERAEKISRALKGKKHSLEHRKNNSEAKKRYWTDETRTLQRKRRIEWLNRKDKTVSKLEISFQNILRNLNIKYIFQYQYIDYNWDFYLPEYDLFIEVHGDFYHCNPNKWIDGPKYKTQELTLKNDSRKHKKLSESGKKLLIFWESEIKENIVTVYKKLLSEVSI